MPQCPAPICAAGTLNQATCKCSSGPGNTKSTCPKGFYEVSEDGLCSCERSSNPTCPKDARLDIRSCICSISETPTCPRGGKVLPHTALCIGNVKPECPNDAVLQSNCQCVTDIVRQCPLGSKLSEDGCECRGGDSTPPVCSGECWLDPFNGCICQSDFDTGKNVSLQVTIH